MSVQEALTTIKKERFNFKWHLDEKGLKPEQLAQVIGKSTSYVRQLLSGNASGQAAHDNLQKLFDFTGYEGENWF